jgi:hypothetical protein
VTSCSRAVNRPRRNSIGSSPAPRTGAPTIGEAVVREARDAGLGRPLPDEVIPNAIAAAQWEPRYAALTPA